MDPKLVLLSAIAAASLVSGASAVAAASLLNITEILNQYPEFSSFNSLLSQTGLSTSINTHDTVTVLVVDGAALGAVSGRPIDEVKRILSVHVVLDYFDYIKLQHLSKKSSTITTLYQASGVAEGMSGFLNVTVSDDGTVTFASAETSGRRSGAGSSFVKEVYSRPYTVSILQVSDVILLPGMSAPPPPPKNSSSPAASPSASEAASPAPAPAADAPAPDAADAPAPAEDDADAPAPAADSPASDAPSPAPASDDDDADADDAVSPAPAADSHSGAGRATVGAGIVFAAAAGLLGSLL